MTKAFLFALLICSTAVLGGEIRQKILNSAPKKIVIPPQSKAVADSEDNTPDYNQEGNSHNQEYDNQGYSSDGEHHDQESYDKHGDSYDYESNYHQNYVEPYYGQDFLATIVAVCDMFPHDSGDISGRITFTQVKGGPVEVEVNLTGLAPRSAHGFHVHEFGDLSNSCQNVGAHFNPFNASHGGPHDQMRQNGDLGNIQGDKHGYALMDFHDNQIQLSGELSVIGRAVVVHQDIDDFGKGHFADSKTVGHAGKKIACCVIGYKNLNEI